MTHALPPGRSVLVYRFRFPNALSRAFILEADMEHPRISVRHCLEEVLRKSPGNGLSDRRRNTRPLRAIRRGLFLCRQIFVGKAEEDAPGHGTQRSSNPNHVRQKKGCFVIGRDKLKALRVRLRLVPTKGRVVSREAQTTPDDLGYKSSRSSPQQIRVYWLKVRLQIRF